MKHKLANNLKPWKIDQGQGQDQDQNQPFGKTKTKTNLQKIPRQRTTRSNTDKTKTEKRKTILSKRRGHNQDHNQNQVTDKLTWHKTVNQETMQTLTYTKEDWLIYKKQKYKTS